MILSLNMDLTQGCATALVVQCNYPWVFCVCAQRSALDWISFVLHSEPVYKIFLILKNELNVLANEYL